MLFLVSNNFPKDGYRILCLNCARSKCYYGYCPHRNLEEDKEYEPPEINYIRKYKNKLKKFVVKEYGEKCECCNESNIEFLTIDHIDNNGAEHRKQDGKVAFLNQWLKMNNFPKDNYRLLCWNCNSARNYYGRCPHEDIKLNEEA